MRSHREKWTDFDAADRRARRAHAGRIAAIGALLDDLPQELIAAKIVARSQVSARTARAWVREASDLRGMPDLTEACARGDLSGDQVTALRVLVAAAPGSDGAWVECLTGEFAGDVPITDLEFRARRQRAADLERTDGGRYLHMKATRDERFVRGRFQLDPEEAALLERQLDARVPDDTRLSDLPRAHADALVALAAEAAAADRPPGSTEPTAHSMVVSPSAPSRDVPGDPWPAPGVLVNGNFVPAGVLAQLGAEPAPEPWPTTPEPGHAGLADLSPFNVRATGLPEVVRRLVWQRDGRRCRFEGCTTPTLGLEIHHMRPRGSGGTHDPSNLILVCARCHHGRIHRDGWRATGDGNALVAWALPDGTAYRPRSIPRARAPSGA